MAEVTNILKASARALVPLIIDHKFLSRVVPVVLSHAVAGITASHVFGAFRKQHLLIDPFPGSHSIFDNADEHPGLLLCLLRLERSKAVSWLKLLSGQSMQSGVVDPWADILVDGIARQVLQDLLQRSSKIIVWDAAADAHAIATAIMPALKQVVLAAVKAQVIASVMHSRLLQLVVPGWLSSTTMMPMSPAPPASWSTWPGVLPFDKQCMDRGGSVKADARFVSSHIGCEAAVFCQEVGVLQLAGRVTDLPEFCSAVPACQHGLPAGSAGPAAGPVPKVLKKPRMFVAAAGVN